MSDLISRSALLQSLRDKGWLKGDMTDSTEMIAVQSIIDDAPAVDAVEVVRCKDCKWLYNGYDQYCCTKHTGLALIKPSGEDFCSYGERRADDD